METASFGVEWLSENEIFQQLVLYSDVAVLCDNTRSQFPFQVWGQGDTGCLLSWLDESRVAVSGAAFTEWVRELDQKVRVLYQ